MKKTFYVTLTLMIIMFAGLSSSSFAADVRKPLIIDVRTAEEWNNGHIEGAILIPYDQIGETIGKVAKNKKQKVYVYCRTGRRSAIAKGSLDKLGYKDVVDLGSLQDAAKILKREIVRQAD
jgi:phage shock protein E